MNKEKLKKAFSAIDKSAAIAAIAAGCSLSDAIAAASDKDKYQEIVKYLTDYPKVEMKSAIYKKKLGIIKDFIADLKG